jgi:aquaporin Z
MLAVSLLFAVLAFRTLLPSRVSRISRPDSMNSAESNLLVRTPPSLVETVTASAPLHSKTLSPIHTLRAHWPEYLMEAGLLGAFMVSACVFGVLYEFPGSPVREAIASPLLRRMLMGASMGLTAVAIIYSPWGKQSGAHINPSVTFTFFRLGKIKAWDAIFYIAAQFIGAALGVMLVAAFAGDQLAHPAVRYVATVPGVYGPSVAFIAELVITFVLMSSILRISNDERLGRYTGLVAGLLVATYITIEAPISGMSMNPARTFGSGVSGGIWTSIWIYFAAPLLGMLAAAETYLWSQGKSAVKCCKLHHQNDKRCIFCGANGGFAHE